MASNRKVLEILVNSNLQDFSHDVNAAFLYKYSELYNIIDHPCSWLHFLDDTPIQYGTQRGKKSE